MQLTQLLYIQSCATSRRTGSTPPQSEYQKIKSMDGAIELLQKGCLNWDEFHDCYEIQGDEVSCRDEEQTELENSRPKSTTLPSRALKYKEKALASSIETRESFFFNFLSLIS